MGNEFVSCSFLLVLLITLAHGNVLRLPSMDGGESDSSMMMGMGVEEEGKDPDYKAYFFMKDVSSWENDPSELPPLERIRPCSQFAHKNTHFPPLLIKGTSLPPPLLLHPPCFPTSLGHGENTHRLPDRTTGRAQGLY
ncbi:hypothetical protein V6N12_042937 [Hibiscus sabdariffa]|uniref:Uncharacterized protein n=1 Tax=Hibiscus sabdariffa TaxID=183260 RepID=A0ABR2BFG1_9ROSI